MIKLPPRQRISCEQNIFSVVQWFSGSLFFCGCPTKMVQAPKKGSLFSRVTEQLSIGHLISSRIADTCLTLSGSADKLGPFWGKGPCSSVSQDTGVCVCVYVFRVLVVLWF